MNQQKENIFAISVGYLTAEKIILKLFMIKAAEVNASAAFSALVDFFCILWYNYYIRTKYDN